MHISVLRHHTAAALAPGEDLHPGPAARRRECSPARPQAVAVAAVGAVAIRTDRDAANPALVRWMVMRAVGDPAQIARQR